MRTLVDILTEFGEAKLNSLTKYPSIQTYHEIDRGCVKANLTDGVSFSNDAVYITEKVDGTNGRIIIYNNDYIIGTREELVYRRGDIFGNPSQGVYNVMKKYAEAMVDKLPNDNKIRVFYGEVYGSNINGFKQYTKHRKSNLRFFDYIIFDNDITDILNKSIEHIALWRDTGGQPFANLNDFHSIIDYLGFSDNTVPYICECSGSDIPISRADTYEWLKQFSVTRATIDEDKFSGRSEGVVVRNFDRTMIRKIRFEDYEKALRKFGML